MLFAHQLSVGFGDILLVAAGVVIWVALTSAYHRGWQRTADREQWRLVVFALASAVVVGVLLPPVEHLAEDLVSVHMVQHVALILVGAPLIALSRPVETVLRAMPRRVRKVVGSLRRVARLTPATTNRVVRPAVVWLLYAFAIWFWHGAGPYELAASNAALHVFEHTMFVGAALAFWSIVLAPGKAPVSPGFRILMVFTTAFHSVLLGALLTFSDTPWYSSYTESTLAVGLDPLADQRLAGLLMWIPGGLVHTGAALWILGSLLKVEDRASGMSWRTGGRIDST